MIKPLRTCFVIADGAHARWVTRDRDTGEFKTIRTMHADEAAVPDREPASEGPHSGSREPREAHKHDAAAFAAQVAKATVDAGRLVIVAPGRLVGEIEAHLSTAAKARVAGRLSKDLTKAADHDLVRWLRPLEL